MKRLFLALLICALAFYTWYYLNSNKNNWSRTFGFTGTNSAPRAIDLNLDGTLDIVLGACGEQYNKIEYTVIVLDGNPTHNFNYGFTICSTVLKPFLMVSIR